MVCKNPESSVPGDGASAGRYGHGRSIHSAHYPSVLVGSIDAQAILYDSERVPWAGDMNGAHDSRIRSVDEREIAGGSGGHPRVPCLDRDLGPWVPTSGTNHK